MRWRIEAGGGRDRNVVSCVILVVLSWRFFVERLDKVGVDTALVGEGLGVVKQMCEGGTCVTCDL